MITGSYAGVLRVPLRKPLSLRFGDLGVLNVELVARA